MIKVSDTAKKKIIDLMKDDGFDAAVDYVRVGVKSGGCSGLSYDLKFDKNKGEPLIQDVLENYVEGRRAQILELLQNDKLIFEMGKDGEPTYKKVDMAPKKCTVLFHFRRNEENTHYFPSIKYEGEFLDFQYKRTVSGLY